MCGVLELRAETAIEAKDGRKTENCEDGLDHFDINLDLPELRVERAHAGSDRPASDAAGNLDC